MKDPPIKQAETDQGPRYRVVRNSMIKILLLIAFIYLGFCTLIACRQASMVYLPYQDVWRTPAEAGLVYEELTLHTSDGEQLAAWYLPAEEARGTMLFCHGNAGNLAHRVDSLRLFHQLGLNVLIFDYRGYGDSTGQPSEKGTYQDALAAWEHLINERQASPHEIVLLGRSLGGAVATWLAISEKPGALILESTFTSIPDMGQEAYPFLPVRLLVRFHYDSLAQVKDVPCPVLIAHSKADEIIKYRHGQRLFEAANEPKQFLEMFGGHNDGYFVSGDSYLNGLDAFLKEHFDNASTAATPES